MRIILSRLFGALRSGNNAAYIAMALKLIAPFTRILDSFRYKRIIQKEIPNILLIICPPRSGGTITFQTLTQVLPVTYVSNYHFLFPKSATAKMVKWNKFGSPSSKFKNYYGYTTSIWDVNEANFLMDKLFKDNPGKVELRKRFLEMVSYLRTGELPLIIKNVKNYLYIPKLIEAVPELKILRIKRDYRQNIQSVLNAYSQLKSFQPLPESIAKMDLKDPLKIGVLQILELNRQLGQITANMRKSDFIELDYNSFCASPESYILQIASFLGIDSEKIRNDRIPVLKASNRIKVSIEDKERIENLLKELGHEGI